MYYSAIGLLAVLVLLIVNWDVLRDQKAYSKPAWIIYRRFLFAVIAYYVTDILWGILEYRKLSAALFADTTVYFIAMAVGIYFWAEYAIAFFNEKSGFGRFLVYSGRGIVALVLGMNAVNIFTPVLFTVDSSSVYTALPMRYVLLACQILFLIVISLHATTVMFRNGANSHERVRCRILASFGIIMALCLFVQLWFPYLPLYSIAYMLGTCLLHAFVASEEKEEHRHKMEEAEKIAELKDRFFSLLDNMPGMAFTKDAETGKYLACNQAFAEYAHKDAPDGVIGLTDAQIFDNETAMHFVEKDKIALSLTKPYIYYDDVTDAMGRPRQLQTTKLKYTDTKGRPCVLGMCQDITDLVSIRNEQAMTKEAYESAVNTGLMYNRIAQTLARDYTEMFYVNTDSEEFTEYRRSEESGTLSEVRHGWHFFSDCRTEMSESVFPDDKEAFLTALNRKKLMKALSSKDNLVLNYRRLTEGEPVYVSMKISRMEDDESFIIIGFTNVDAEIREAIAKNEALSIALSSAEAASKSRNTFLSGMSHELRTPINAIIGLDTLALRNSKLDSKTREHLEKIGDSARHLLSIINDILNMIQMETGHDVLRKSEFSLAALLEQVTAQVKKQCSEKGLTFESVISEQPGDLYFGDDVKLKKVLNNILSNAVKFTDAPGSVTLTAEKTAEFEDRATVRFRIKDTGIGIDKEYLPRIFDAFSQDEGRSRTKNGSSGLGLAITKRIVEMMNGSVSVESEKGKGTEFTVMITLRKADSSDVSFGRLDTDALYILVVDDNPIEAEHAKTVLEEAGIRTDFCTDGKEALRKMEIQHLRKHPYNIVLMDWNMPGMNGMETSEEIIRLYANESIVAAMTAYSWNDIREEANSVGVFDYVEKPLFAASIIDDLERIARRSGMAIFKEKNRARLEGRRILLAEDMELNAEILMDMLEMENIKADHAENGKIAVELFEKSTAGIYSAILMDVRMPVMDGLEAAKAIRAMDREDAGRIPIIALTANAFDEDVQLSMQAGMNAHLSKPVEAERLIKILGELIYESEQKITGK
ncbi:Signal transduction histidine kinase [Ruminococcaceae bacterium FB2012]|nr:Signal transduction histidine kinase [Ruminococcaceae bacterium FB2012]